MNKSSIFLILALVISSCHKPISPVFREIKNVRLRGLPTGSQQAELAAELIMFNPNPFSVDLKGSDLNLYLGEQMLGKAKQTMNIRVPAKGNFSLPVNLRILSSTLLKNSLKLLSNDSIELGAKGSVIVGKAGINKKIDIDYKGRHKLPKLSLF